MAWNGCWGPSLLFELSRGTERDYMVDYDSSLPTAIVLAYVSLRNTADTGVMSKVVKTISLLLVGRFKACQTILCLV